VDDEKYDSGFYDWLAAAIEDVAATGSEQSAG
jgi:hypothetical protein